MAGDLRLSMLLELKAQAAIAEAARFRAEAEALAKSVKTAGREGAASATDLAKVPAAAASVGGALEKATSAATTFNAALNAAAADTRPLVVQINQASEASHQLAAAEDVVAAAITKVVGSQELASRSAAQLISQIALTNAAYDGNTRALLGSTTAIQRLVEAQDGLTSSAGRSVVEQIQYQATLDQVRARFDPLFAASRRYEQELAEIAEAEKMGALSALGAAAARDRAAQGLAPLANGLKAVGQSAQGASMHVTQIGYQLNDIGMMLAAGQNPLMLALQQGTQLNQNFEMMRANGLSVGVALRQAFLNLLNPMSLVTLGAIAAGAFAVQAFMSMGGEVKTVDEALGDLKTTAGEFAQAAGRDIKDLTRDFGGLSDETVRLQENLTLLAQARAIEAARGTIQGLKGLAEGSWLADFNGKGFTDFQQASIALDVNPQRLSANGIDLEANPVIGKFQDAVNAAAGAKGWSAQLAAIRDVEAAIVEAAGGIDQMSTAQATLYGQVLETESAINRIVAAENAAARQRIDMARGLGTENARMGGPSQFDRADPEAKINANLQAARARQSAAEAIAAAERENDLARTKLLFGEQGFMMREKEAEAARAATEAEIRRLGIALQGNEAVRMRAATEEAISLAARQREADARSASARMMGDLQAEARIVQLTAQYGADSLEVAYARVGAEREAYQTQLAAQGVTGQTAAGLMSAWDAARGIAAVNMAAGIGAAAAEAQLMAAQLGISLDHALGLMGIARGAAKPGGGTKLTFGGIETAPGSGPILGFGDLSSLPRAGTVTPSSDAGGSGSRGGARGEATSIRELIAAQERELALLRETDPVKRELLELSKDITKATPAERAQLEGLIRTRMAEKDALEAVKSAQEELRSSAKSGFIDLVTGANNFGDALSSLLAKMAEMAASSLFDSIWSPAGSGGGGGNFLGGLMNILGFADGGLIQGQGGPREDNQLARVSVGEYIVNAEATSRHLPLLEALNSGQLTGSAARRLPAFASGGVVGARPVATYLGEGQAAQSGASGSSAGAAPVTIIQHIHVDGATGNAEVREMVAAGVAQGLEMHDREVLPLRVKDIISNDRVTGR